jgi:predicted transcriptional regulator
MQINLPSELEPFVEQEFATGRYATHEEVLVLAPELLRIDREQALAWIREGLSDVAFGRTQPLADAFEDIRRQFDISARHNAIQQTESCC